jgi:hypothetical protein
MSNGDIPLGDIRFYDSYRPLLEADDYTIKVTQQVDSTDTAHPLSAQVTVTQQLSVTAPRFALDPSEVQSAFPPANAVGAFAQNLPHVVLMQRALPWERDIEEGLTPPLDPHSPGVKAYPWLALLLFTADEIVPPASATAASLRSNPTLVGTYAVTQLLTPEAGVLGPTLDSQAEDETTCRAIDISTDVFTRLTPRLAELPYLAHARQVNVDPKSISLALTSGWFSVVVANRFPASSKSGTRNIAHLVSLEGFADFLCDAPVWKKPNSDEEVTTVRLASLASWTFTAQEGGLDFGQLMLNLKQGQLQGGDGLRLRLPVPAAQTPPSPGSADDLARKALAQGYAALPYETRVGDKTFAWYHGPLTPYPVAPLASTAFSSSAAATVYDPQTGTFDLSYAVAWELGRLLALSDRAYATNQQRARKALRKAVNLVRERTRWAEGRRILGDAEGNGLAELVRPRQVSGALVSWLRTEAAKLLPGQGPAIAPPPAPAPQVGKSDCVASLTALHAHPAVQALLGDHLGAAMEEGPLGSVVDWLGRLRLLEGVPFVHLVPDARMLPVESIRFFYVDGNALDALCDGAQSVGVQSSRDAAQQQVARNVVRDAAIRRGHAHRASLLRKPLVKPMLQAAQPGDPVAGFLLRSAVVSGWPGLEVRAWENLDGTGSIDPVRLEHVASDVLLALYPQVPARIDFDEPKEGLAFGVEDDGKVIIRTLSGGVNMGSTTPSFEILGSTFLRDSSRVVKLDAWQKALAAAPALGEPTPSVWGPAAFALQMVRAPEQMIFDNGGGA